MCTISFFIALIFIRTSIHSSKRCSSFRMLLMIIFFILIQRMHRWWWGNQHLTGKWSTQKSRCYRTPFLFTASFLLRKMLRSRWNSNNTCCRNDRRSNMAIELLKITQYLNFFILNIDYSPVFVFFHLLFSWLNAGGLKKKRKHIFSCLNH